jgi:hypothetical protein
MQYTDDEAFKLCDLLQKILLERSLIEIIQRDTIVAEKLQKTITMAESGNVNALKDEDFLDPFIGMERAKANYNTSFEKGKLAEVAKKAKAKDADALDRKIAEFM